MTQEVMPVHIGTKSLKAKPMTLGDYNALRSWPMPGDQSPEQEGYLVEYQDSASIPNVPGYDGYVSWSPKEVFENSYQSIDHMDFGAAFHAIKSGHGVARAGWNSKIYVFLAPNGFFMYAMKTDSVSTDTSVPEHWSPDAMDLKADDWYVVL